MTVEPVVNVSAAVETLIAVLVGVARATLRVLPAVVAAVSLIPVAERSIALPAVTL